MIHVCCSNSAMRHPVKRTIDLIFLHVSVVANSHSDDLFKPEIFI